MNVCFEIPSLTQPVSLALGTFDGLHLGHRQVIGEMSRQARIHQLPQWVFTFQNHPAEVLRPDLAPPLLTTWPEKLTLLRQAAELEGIIMLPFDEAFSHTAPEDFVREILVKRLQVSELAVGFNFHFGYQAKGSPALLQKMGKELDFGVEVVPACEAGGQPISSTRIRQLITGGELEAALTLLDGHFLIQGEVIRGQGIAAKILGVPTANLKLEHERKVLPPKGVYACLVRLPGQAGSHPAVMNLGNRPTFAGQSLSLEVYVMDFEGDLYGQTLEVYLQAFLRPEQRFEGPEALKVQIRKDIAQARMRLSDRRV